jgi:hypothetical protein
MVNRLDGNLTTCTEVAQLSHSKRDETFKSADCKLWNFLLPDKTCEELDIMTVGEKSYITIYDKIKKKEGKHGS